MKGNGAAGHLSAPRAILIWGTAVISAKILLVDFQPAEILFFRFAMGPPALFVVASRRLKGTNRQQESIFAAAGLFLPENKLFVKKGGNPNGLAE